jgi:hypothetical protein
MKGGSNELSMTKMNYISMATVNANCWVALKNMCDSYDQGFTYFSEKAKINKIAGYSNWWQQVKKEESI